MALKDAYYLPHDEAKVDRLGAVIMESQFGPDVERMYQSSSIKAGG